jgi:hypothetical protein
MLLHVVPGQPACLDSPSPHKLPPRIAPACRPPKGTRGQPSAAASSRAPGHRHIAARVACGGRMPSASIVPPASWPCRPSTTGCPVRRSRHPAALSKPAHTPPPSHSPRRFAVAFRCYAATHAGKTPCHIQTTIQYPDYQPIPLHPNPQHSVLPPASACVFTSAQAARCALRARSSIVPLAPSAPKGRARCFSLRRAARAR